jgi:hypothetical protein
VWPGLTIVSLAPLVIQQSNPAVSKPPFVTIPPLPPLGLIAHAKDALPEALVVSVAVTLTP